MSVAVAKIGMQSDTGVVRSQGKITVRVRFVPLIQYRTVATSNLVYRTEHTPRS